MSNRNRTVLPYQRRKDADKSILEILEKYIDAMGTPRFLYLSPTKRKNREMERAIQEIRQTWKGLFLTPTGLAAHILRKSGRPFRAASEEMRRLVAVKILERSRESGALAALASFDKPVSQGLAKSFLQAMDRFIAQGRSIGEGSIFQSHMAQDIESFTGIFEVELDKRGLINPAAINGIAGGLILDQGAELLGPPDLMVLDGFTMVEPDEQDLILSIVDSRPGMEILVTLPRELIHALKEKGPQDLPPSLRIYNELLPVLDSLGIELSQHIEDGDIIPRTAPLEDHLTIESFPDRVTEVKAIAARIKKIVGEAPEGSVAPEDFHVAAPGLEPYYRLFIEIFPAYGVPFNITRGIPLLSIPVAGLLRTMLKALIRRDYSSVFNFFSSNLVETPPPEAEYSFEAFLERHWSLLKGLFANTPQSIPQGQEANELDPSLIDNACRDYRVTGGPVFQRDWLEPFVTGMEFSIARSGANEESYRIDFAAQRAVTILRQLWLLEREFLEMDSALQTKTMRDLASNILGLVSRYGIVSNLYKSLLELDSEMNVAREIVLEKNARGLNRALELVNEVAETFEILGDDDADPLILNDALTQRWGEEMIQEAGELAGVSVSQTLEIRNISRKYVFLAGLTSDAFPISGPSNFLMGSGPRSGLFNRWLNLSNYLLDQALQNSEHVIISHPQSDQGSPLEPSILVQDLMGAQAAIAPQDKEGLEGPFSRQESLRLAAQVWNEEPVDWDALKAALESYPLAGSTSAQTRFHDEIRRRLMSDLIRRHEVKTGAFDGIIGHPELLRAIGEHVGAPGFRYSPKVINTYLSCPFEFFMQCILGLEPAAEIAEELEGRDLGQFAHEILALFHQKISENGMIRVTPGNRIQSLGLMGEIANGYLSEKPYFQRNSMDAWSVRERLTRGLVFQDTDKEEIERIKKGVDVSRNRRGMLRALIDHEADLDARLKPVRTEFGFGFSGSRTLEIIDRDRVIRVVGRIDRIDHYDGPAENGETVWVYDYKTGKAPTLGSVKNGLDLQLQIYLMAILDLYEDVRPASVGGCFLELNPSNEDLRRVVIYTPQVPPDLLNGVGRSSLEMGPDKIESCREIIRHIDRSIRNGAFPRAKNRANCHNCRYGFVCYRDEYKVGRLWEGSVQDHMDYI